MRYSAHLFLSIIFLGILPGLADACVLNGPHYRLQADTVRWSLEVGDGEDCIRGVRFNNMVVDKLMVASLPQVGHLTLHGTGFSYKAASDFQGRDFFSLVLSGTANKIAGSSTIEVLVSISRASELGSLPSVISLPSHSDLAGPSPTGPGTSSPPLPPPVNDCDSSNGVAVISAPTTNACGAGSAVGASEPWPHSSCTDSNGGTTASCSVLPFTTTEPAEKPGPSAALFSAPFYICLRNFYVSPSGNDRAAGTEDAPWKTIQRADNAAGGRVAGDCVNVAPGTYATGLAARHGGSAATATGYVVYRCQQLDACKITALGGQGDPAFFVSSSGNGPNYLVLDGFELAASRYAAYGVGAGMYFPNGIDNHTPSSHHVWVINNIIHGFGQSGIDMGGGDYLYYIHNLSYANSHVTCDAQGSGIGIVIPRAAANYIPTTMDNQYAPFHNLVMWNVSHDNMLTECGNATSAYDTDGNGIIMDSFKNKNSTGIAYPYQTLVANNVVYGNGGGGVKAFFSSFITIANNTAYNNDLDPFNVATGRGEIGTLGGNNNVFLNNIAYPVPATTASDPRCKGVSNQSPAPCPLMLNAAFVGGDGNGGDQTTNIWSHNISFGGTPPWGWGPQGNAMLDANTMNCSSGANSNKCNVDPGLTNPSASNFTLTAASPAIGYGLAESYLSSQSLDAGAYDHRLSAR